jgi:glycosyltransferase A (GT-A) superfamily protein (DUF2064 family)
VPRHDRAHVLVVAKAPCAGRVKTRLCPPCSPSEAASIAEAALADTLETVAACHADRRVIALDGPPGAWLPPGFDIVAQVAGELQRRLAAAWAAAGGPGVQIGMDTPQVTPELLDLALDAVTAGPRAAALGLAVDGGWWAIGFAHPQPAAFTGIRMSTPTTGRAQHDRLITLGLEVNELAELRDIDTFDDALAVAATVPESRTAQAVDAVAATLV